MGVCIAGSALISTWPRAFITLGVAWIAHVISIIRILFDSIVASRVTVNFIGLVIDISSGGAVKPDINQIAKIKIKLNIGRSEI